MGISEFLYYTILKHGKIIIIILGIIVGVLVFTFFATWGMNLEYTTESTVKYCDTDEECVYHCGQCFSLPSQEICEPCPECVCICVNNTCQLA